ncbi:MAG: (2Fe-2S)-binding protein [Candidatus Thermofonsia Clade 1 bacterium]|jgi:ferredoxin|uniref:(2Fe-2S)-binding protein n=1 Tax=Candidatus Thermofonsia Clade 1 bacterium TaxID=2364210 RepID=A0A2M8PAS3_9CHLR|nr:MAG: (2Fe-2S)-binding protein [Candidatus Thermofonsia Clade 1 bacterium]RMF54256.1 MAG: (2Fe-2S)-binding protein [Chloroflexota bacterium]
MTEPITHTLTVITPEGQVTLNVPDGANLRQALLAADLSPHGALSRRANCGGRGLCATCGVWIEANAPAPSHWHDRIGAAFGYPRLSCQIAVHAPLLVRLVPNKIIWGKPERARRYRAQSPE